MRRSLNGSCLPCRLAAAPIGDRGRRPRLEARLGLGPGQVFQPVQYVWCQAGVGAEVDADGKATVRLMGFAGCWRREHDVHRLTQPDGLCLRAAKKEQSPCEG